jgi:diguanylate cyclase (GGDEF)-like protein
MSGTTSSADSTAAAANAHGLAVLDSLVDAVAVLDLEGVICTVNVAWRQFAWRNGCTHGTSPIGVNYLRVCEQAAGTANGEEGPAAAAGIRAVLAGRRGEFRLEYPCHSLHEQRWFIMTVTRLKGSPSQVVVCHRNITEQKRAEIAARLAQAMLRQLAEEDPCTGMPNRMILMQRLEALAARRRDEPGFRFTVFFVAWDRFDFLGEALGFEVGDELNGAIARRLRTLETADSFAARFDATFAFVAIGIAGRDAVLAEAERLQTVLAPTYPVRGHQLESSVSIGAASSDAAPTPVELLRNAGIALEEARRRACGATVLFDRSLYQSVSRRWQLEAALRHALQRREFAALYQPVVEMRSGRLLWVEAQPHWCHPELGHVAATEFQPLAQASGMRGPISEWLLRESCLQWHRWQRLHPAAAPAGISVDLPRAGSVPQLTGMVRAVLEEARMPTAALQLEIAEPLLLERPDEMRALVESLHGIGVRLALDDFQGSAASLASLRHLPFDCVKLAKTVAADAERNAEARAVSATVIRAIEGLGLVSIAQGIDDPQTLALLQSLGCRCGQGVLFSLPMPAEGLQESSWIVPSRAGTH